MVKLGKKFKFRSVKSVCFCLFSISEYTCARTHVHTYTQVIPARINKYLSGYVFQFPSNFHHLLSINERSSLSQISTLLMILLTNKNFWNFENVYFSLLLFLFGIFVTLPGVICFNHSSIEIMV